MNTLPAKVSESAVTVRETEPLSIEKAFHAVVHGELDADKLAVMKDLLAMDAERKFNAAFVELQAALPAIRGFRGIPDKSGRIKFVYANFDDIDAVVRQICGAFGFSYSFRETAMENNRVTMTMTLQHCAGHSREIPYSVRVGSGPPGATDSQADVSGHTYAKRGCIESGLSLRIIGDREDAKMEGNLSATVTQAQADELERRAQLLNCAVPFLKYANATKFSDIAAHKYDELDQLLRRKEQKGE